MIPCNQMPRIIISPLDVNLANFNKDEKSHFLSIVGDEKSFDFSHFLSIYSLKKNDGKWPRIITPKILKFMEKEAEHDITVEETKIYADGYLIKHGVDYELTHELIVLFYLCFPAGGKILPINTVDIDFSFSNEEKWAEALQNYFHVEDPQALIFLVKILNDMGKTSGPLMNRVYEQIKLLEIAEENKIDFSTCMYLAREKYKVLDKELGFKVACRNLVLMGYLSSPKIIKYETKH